MYDADGSAHDGDLAGVVPGVLGPDPVDLEVVLGDQLEPGVGGHHDALGREHVLLLLPDQNVRSWKRKAAMILYSSPAS